MRSRSRAPRAGARPAAVRRGAAALAALAAVAAGPAGAAQGVYDGHGVAMHGEPSYPEGFEHFDYVNPDAPKGGSITLAQIGTFDSFNPFIPKGTPGPGWAVETLMAGSADEPFTEYGLIAERIEMPEDRSWVAFTLREEARWHDGRPITVEDVIWSFETLTTKGRPIYRFYYASVAAVERAGPRRVKFTFKESGNRELPLIMGQLPVLPRHWFEEAGRDFAKTTLEPPLGSGPYRVAEFEPGRRVVLERVEDYWAKDLPVKRGHHNFDEIRHEYFRDATVVRQALKSGDIDYREENVSKSWALEYDVPSVRKGWLVKELAEHERPAGMQAFVMNTRRAIFADPRVREAIAHAFDFEWTNEHLFFGQYRRTESYFANSDLASSGLPEGDELAILERYRGRVPDDVFTEVYDPPRTKGDGWPRKNLRRAFELLESAGWVVRDMELVERETGRPMSFEFLLVQQDFKRVVLPFVRNLARLGIDVRVRVVDTSQYINRLRSFDFDVIVGGWGQSDSPGNEQREYWSSAAADAPGSRNYAGVRDPVVDELVAGLIQAPTREALVARTRALDRVLLHGHYVVPNWHLSAERLLYWNEFSRPEVTPKNGTDIEYWWYDEAKAAALEAARARGAMSASPGASTPSYSTIAFAAAALAVIGFVVFRRVWR